MRFRLVIFLAIVIGIVLSTQRIFAQTPEDIDVEFDDEEFGQVTQWLGVIVPNNLSPEIVTQLKSTFPNGGVYLKIVNPTVASVNSTPFRSLTESHFNWYFSFADPNSSFAVIDAYKANFSLDRLVVEIEKDDLASGVADLRGTYPTIKIHAGNLPVWPRSQVNEILAEYQPPEIEGISFWLGLIDEGEGVYRDVEFTFDTIFDASKSIAGEEINFPSNTILAISDNRFPLYDGSMKTAYLSGLLSGAAITTVQSQGRSGEAPIRYIIPGTFSQFSASDRIVLTHFARFNQLSPRIVWPYAIPNNGDIWGNGIFEKSNTKPLVGVIGKVSDGYYGFLTNAGDEPIKADLATEHNFSAYTKVSTTKSAVNMVEGDILLDPNETVIFHPASLTDMPTPTGSQATATPGNGTPTNTPVPQTSCADKQKTGDYNCDGTVNDEDFDVWFVDFSQKDNISLTLFEYWRRNTAL